MEDAHQRSPQDLRRIGIEGVGLGLHRPARTGESKSRKALCHEAPSPHGATSSQEMVRPLDTQAVGHGRCGGTVGVPHVLRGHLSGQRRELMHDHLGLCGRHRSGDRVGVEGVGHDRMRSQTAHQVLL